MNKSFKLIAKIIAFSVLTILTQIGGITLVLSEFISTRIKITSKYYRLLNFGILYLILTLFVIPKIAPLFGREKVRHSDTIKPTSVITVFMNRNYVKPQLNKLLKNVEKQLINTGVTINYLDANFPFINKFPLLPHLSHNDGKKLDISLIYETHDGIITNDQRSNSGYGVFESPNSDEFNQIKKCIDHGYFQYDYPKYLTLGSINENLIWSSKGTKILINSILQEPGLGMLFIEPHLKDRLGIKNKNIKYHGCKAVRHDDHIHIQLQ